MRTLYNHNIIIIAACHLVAYAVTVLEYLLKKILGNYVVLKQNVRRRDVRAKKMLVAKMHMKRLPKITIAKMVK